MPVPEGRHGATGVSSAFWEVPLLRCRVARAQQPRAHAAHRRVSCPCASTMRHTGPPVRVSGRPRAIGLDRRPQHADRCSLVRAAVRTKPASRRPSWRRSRRTSILAHGNAAMAPLRQATRTVPVVFAIVPDPVGAGFVSSLSRPGGNATGFMPFEFSIGGNGWSCSRRSRRA